MNDRKKGKINTHMLIRAKRVHDKEYTYSALRSHMTTTAPRRAKRTAIFRPIPLAVCMKGVERERQTERQTDRQTERQTDRQTERRIHTNHSL
jgi:hypothetical protein